MVKRFLPIAVLVLFAAVAAAGPPMHPLAERHFDHAAHDAAIHARGGTPPACAHCHPTSGTTSSLVDRGTSDALDHGFCQGAGCHGDAFAKDTRCAQLQATGRAPVCAVCHVQATCFATPPAPAVPMAARFAHAKHAGFAASIEPECAMCHRAEAGATASAAPADAHRTCAGCHASGAHPAMTECAGCHTGAAPAAAPPRGDFAVAFVHPLHAQISRQNACATCHVATSSDPFAPVPATMAACARACHDGNKAFATTGTTCTQCHQSTAPATKVVQIVPFSHAAHAQRGVAIQACDTCHAAQPDGTLAPPLAGKQHQPCAKSGCHANDYASRTPMICGVCHDAASPWQKEAPRVASNSAVKEWFTGIDHAAHLRALPGGSANQTCEQCHPGQLAGAPQPQGHAQCAPCHAKGQNPPMADCAACHLKSSPPRPPESAWSVAANFKHATHATDPRTRGATACTACHTTVAAAKDLASIAAPTMGSCDACHDGQHAFKSTGFACARCHAKPAKVSWTPALTRPGSDLARLSRDPFVAARGVTPGSAASRRLGLARDASRSRPRFGRALGSLP